MEHKFDEMPGYIKLILAILFVFSIPIFLALLVY